MSLRSTSRRVVYYVVNGVMDFLPHCWHLRRKARFLNDLAIQPLSPDEQARLDCYNKLESEFGMTRGVAIKDIPMGRTFYYFDLKRFAKCFNPKSKLRYVFGDVTFVPDEPSIVKSRPITADNRNSVLMKLDRLRHYDIIEDRLPFRQKRPVAVWRGNLNNTARLSLILAHAGKAFCDVAYIGRQREDAPKPGAYLSREEQLRCKYIISIEGRDVATNLKWIMASNSLCIMPAPKFETWFAESLLVPDFHYAPVKDDFSDLEAVIERFERDPAAAEAIIANAQAYVAPFRNRRRENILSYLVLEKYLRLARPVS